MSISAGQTDRGPQSYGTKQLAAESWQRGRDRRLERRRESPRGCMNRQSGRGEYNVLAKLLTELREIYALELREFGKFGHFEIKIIL